MPDPALIDPAAAAIAGIVQSSPLVGLALGWMWLQRRRPAPPETSCVLAAGADGTLSRLDKTTLALVDLATAQRETSAAVAVTLAKVAQSNDLLLTQLRDDADRLRRIEREASEALKYSQWVQGGGKGSGA